MQNEIQTKEENGSQIGKTKFAQDPQENLSNLEEQSSDSKESWQLPTSAKALAKQANLVATMVLNNQMDIQTAQKYSALVRGISQLMSLEVAKARIEKTSITLDLI